MRTALLFIAFTIQAIQLFADTTIKGVLFNDGDLLFKVTNDDIPTCSVNGIYNVTDGPLVIPSIAMLKGVGYTVTSIADNAFADCQDLTYVVIPNSVTLIGKWSFWNCSNLTSIEIPNSVTFIDDYAIDGCSKLSYINIPNSVISIGHSALAWCSSLESIELPNSVTHMGVGMFIGCSNLKSIKLPESISTIETATFKNCNSLTSFSMPESVTYIGGGAFENCSNLENVDIPNTVTGIDTDAFAGCVSLSSINIPSNITDIGIRAFGGCNNLKSVRYDCENPIALDESIFDQDIYLDAILYMPKKGLEANVTPWNMFAHTEVIEDAGIEDAKSDMVSDPGSVYNLNGIKVDDSLERLKHGIYIVNGKKVIITGN